jgi:hypothetical protein
VRNVLGAVELLVQPVIAPASRDAFPLKLTHLHR